MINSKSCFHCGEKCDGSIQEHQLDFCCNGCKQIYLLLNENDLCQYYELENNPGIKVKGKFIDQRFAYLNDPSVVKRLALFIGNEQVNISFSLPQMHCSSCVFLLEKLSQINDGIIRSSVDFTKKSIFISYHPGKIKLKELVELLSFIGYEPEITLEDVDSKQSKKRNWKSILQIGIAGFCFSNIMMLSFPDYFSGGHLGIDGLKSLFSSLIVTLSLPVLFYSAAPIFVSAFRGLRQRHINIDAPIALASIITFSRSYYEIFSGTGSGYLDSGTGIIFFMLIGRWFQNKTYDALSFDRKYKSYFPLGITIIKDDNEETSIAMNQLKIGDKVITRNEELIPADAILISEFANLDYSFVTGENATHQIKKGELIFAGGKQIGSSIITEVVKLPSQSYITELWNNGVFNKNKENQSSFVHPWSRYFTIALFSIAIISGTYWSIFDSSKIWLVITSVLIVACPCSLMLSATFTYGNMLRMLGKRKLFLKNANVIESISDVTDIVFDKTGTITEQSFTTVSYFGHSLHDNEKAWVKMLSSHSGHVLSKGIFQHMNSRSELPFQTNHFKEEKGRGMEGVLSGHVIKMGNASFVSLHESVQNTDGSEVHVSIDETYKGFFKVTHKYRNGLDLMLPALRKNYNIHLLSGDRDSDRSKILTLFGPSSEIHFSVLPQDKLNYIKKLQDQGKKVLMIGDGLNDAGALMQANVGLAVSENQAHFTPASDGIIEGSEVVQLPDLLSYAKSGKKMVAIGFFVSLLYNIIGVGFAVQGMLSPVVAAILMPISSITIVSLAIALSSLWGSAKSPRVKYYKNQTSNF